MKNILVLSLAFMILTAALPGFSGEFPIIDDSTVVGRNYGYPTGTPVTGRTEVGNLDLIFGTTVYAKNLELLGVGVDGATFIGFLSPFRLRYRPHRLVTIEAGALLGYDFGDGENFDEVEPILRLVYEPVKKAFVFAGNIIRTHFVHDALYDDAVAFDENSEQGLQFRADFKGFKEDIWINWRIKETPVRSERFDFGNVSQFRFGDFWLDAQLYWRHTGGQRNLEDKVEHNISYLLGGSYGFFHDVSISFLTLIEEIRIGAYYLGDRDIPDGKSGIEESSGGGVEGRIVVDLNPSKDVKVNIFSSYFAGDELLCRAGDPLYSKDEYVQLGTNVIFYLPAGLRIEAGVVGQLLDGTFVHTEQLYFSWGKGFTLYKGI